MLSHNPCVLPYSSCAAEQSHSQYRYRNNHVEPCTACRVPAIVPHAISTTLSSPIQAHPHLSPCKLKQPTFSSNYTPLSSPIHPHMHQLSGVSCKCWSTAHLAASLLSPCRNQSAHLTHTGVVDSLRILSWLPLSPITITNSCSIGPCSLSCA